jgi:urease accessory protein
VLINTAGGLTGGDRLEWEAEVGDGAALTLTTQACEKVYRAGEGEAQITCRLRVGEDAFLAWLPQETILFDRRRCDGGWKSTWRPARALILEATIFGRTAMGEEVQHAAFRDRWRVRVGGRLVHAEDSHSKVPWPTRCAARPPARRAPWPRSLWSAGTPRHPRLQSATCSGPSGGASAWTVGDAGKLLARLTATDGHALRQRLIPLLQLLSGEAGLPKIWSS